MTFDLHPKTEAGRRFVIASVLDEVADLLEIEGGKFPQASVLMNGADSQHLLCE